MATLTVLMAYHDHCVHLIDLETSDDPHVISTLGEKGYEGYDSQRFYGPYFVTFLSTPQKRGLYVCDYFNNRIQYYHRVSRG
jgi:hypothetical protein